ncbi:MAG TPA: response regulator [Terriglobales bacterium]|jgi:two-component system response regulator GlrR|nr:response regulator [Terriglobales bacterium]
MARILCIDDERDILELHSIVLRRAGHEVIAVGTGEEALGVVASQAVDLVVSDLLRGVEGADYLARIRQARPAAPILVLSGYPERPQGLEFVDEFLSKGSRAGELVEVVERLLREAPGWAQGNTA